MASLHHKTHNPTRGGMVPMLHAQALAAASAMTIGRMYRGQMPETRSMLSHQGGTCGAALGKKRPRPEGGSVQVE